MSPLRSSPSSSTIHSNSHHYEPNPYTSTDEAKEPQTKKLKLYLKKTYKVVPPSQLYTPSNSDGSHSSTTSTSDHIEVHSTASDQEYEIEQTKPTTKTKKRRKSSAKKPTKLHKQSVLSKEQISALKSATISLQEFINIYDSVPVKLRNKPFYATCRTYIYELSKTKTTMAEKQTLFASLPQTLNTSFPLFELIFKPESVVLFNIMSGKTDVKDLQNSIKTLLPFFSPSYLQKQIYQFTKHNPDLSIKDKNIISTCRKYLRHLEKQSKSTLSSSKKTLMESSTASHTDDTDSAIEDKTISKHKLHPEAKRILDSFKNHTIDIKDIITSRQKLVLLEVDRRLIHNALRSFKNTISMSHRSDKNEILQQLKESGKQASKIRSTYIPISNDLKNLYSQALKGTLPIHLIKDLRKLLFEEYNISKASSSLQSAKNALIKHNKQQEAEIRKAFAKEYRQRDNYSHHYKFLKEKIKSGNLKPSQFAYIYDSIPQQNRVGTLSKICNEYIKKQSEQIKSFEDKLNLLRDLPQSLQKSPSVISILFPYESSIMSSIRNGTISSSDIHKHLSELLKIIDIQHITHIIGQYVTSKKHLTKDEKTHIAQCRSALRQLPQTNTHKLAEEGQKPQKHKQKLHPESNSDDEEQKPQKHKQKLHPESNSDNEEQKPQKHKQKLHPEAKKILESLDNGTIDTKNILSYRKKLILLKVDRCVIKNSFNRFRYHVQKLHRPDMDEVLQTINESGKHTSKIKSIYTNASNQLQALLDKAYSGVLPLEEVDNLRNLIFKEYTAEQAYSCLQKAKKSLIKHNKDKEQLISQAFTKARTQQPNRDFKINLNKHNESEEYKYLKTAIKSGNLHVQEFTRLYHTITSSKEMSSIHKMTAPYIHDLSQQITQLQDKIATVMLLPKTLQTSISTIKSFFPQQHAKMSLIRSGQIKSEELKETCLELLDVINITHIRRLLSKYVSNKRSMTIREKHHVSECRQVLLDMQNNQSAIYTEGMQDDKVFTITSPTTKSTLSTSFNQTDTSVEYEENNKKQVSFPIKSPVGSSIHYPNPWDTAAQPIHLETSVDILEEQTDTTSPQYTIEIDDETAPQLSLEQISSDELACILQSIVAEDESNKDHILLQNYILQLANELQQEPDTVEQAFYKQTNEQPSTSQSITYTNLPDTHTDELTHNDETPQIPEEFLCITEMTEDLSHEEMNKLADTIEVMPSIQNTDLEDFLDFMELNN